jgi:hypothetical protein
VLRRIGKMQVAHINCLWANIAGQPHAASDVNCFRDETVAALEMRYRRIAESM